MRRTNWPRLVAQAVRAWRLQHHVTLDGIMMRAERLLADEADPDGGFDSDDGATRSYDAASYDAGVEAAAHVAADYPVSRGLGERIAEAIRALKGGAGEPRPAATREDCPHTYVTTRKGETEARCYGCGLTLTELCRGTPKPKPARKGGKRRGT